MSIYKKLQGLNLNNDATISLRYSEGTDVFIHNETEVETAMAETDVINRLSELIATRGLHAQSRWGENIINELRSSGFLEEYERDNTFSDFLSETISENFYDFEFIETSTEKYDYKRGFCTLTAKVSVTANNLLKVEPNLDGWNVSIKTSLGILTLDE